MNNLKHTEGEWVDGNTSDSIIVKGLNSDSDSDKYYGGFVICESVTQNNKPIIKAAPEMLKAMIISYKELSALWDALYGQNMSVIGWHLNGDLEKVDNFFEENNYNAVESLKIIIEKATGMSIEKILK